jgi:hypothetical protein
VPWTNNASEQALKSPIVVNRYAQMNSDREAVVFGVMTSKIELNKRSSEA